MTKTVLVTGSSTGIGKAAVKRFLDEGWNVVATMRSPAKETELKNGDNCLLSRLDVTDSMSIKNAINEGIDQFGKIDALVNNAGYGLSGTFESMSMQQVRKQFDTNVFGLMEVSQRILPHFRANGGGTLINVASMGGRCTFPLYSVYHATKWAVDGFSESLQFELRPQNIRVKIIEPGAIKTDFYDRSADVAHDESLTEYNAFVNQAKKAMDAAGNKGAPASKVADAIFKAANDSGWKLRYPVGSDAKGMLATRRFVSDRMYQFMIRKALGVG